jgi:hypothetical protein
MRTGLLTIVWSVAVWAAANAASAVWLLAAPIIPHLL